MDKRKEPVPLRSDDKPFVDKVNSPPESHVVTAGVLDYEEMIDIQTQFGVDEEQVRRDHAISHALAALSDIDNDDLVFFGGTALSRTILTHVRLSEDIDLIALALHESIASHVHAAPNRCPMGSGARPSMRREGDGG